MDNPCPTLHPTVNRTATSEEAQEIFEYIRDIKDPEHPYTLEQLGIVSEDKIRVCDDGYGTWLIFIEFTPTVAHCSLASLIALSIREKLRQELTVSYKLCVFITPGTHSTEAEINKQVNDKERVAAAMENPHLSSAIRQCLSYQSSLM